MSARRRYRRTRNHPVVLVSAALVAFMVATAALHILGVILIAAAAAAIAYGVGRKSRPAIRAKATTAKSMPVERWETIPQGDMIPPVAPSMPQQQARKFDARARKNGWLPPAAPELAATVVSQQCAEQDCISCPGLACACLCRHESARIVAINSALHGLLEQAEQAPF